MSIASTKVTEGQIDEICRTADAFTKAVVRNAVIELIGEGKLQGDGAQRVITKGDRLKDKMVSAYKAAIMDISTPVTTCLKSISSGTSITIGATAGKKLISWQKKVFPGWIDPDFEKYGCNVPGEAKPETPVEVFEMTQNADFRTMFGSLDVELDSLALTQEQIIAFVEDYSNWLHPEGWATFFLFKANGQFFVAVVRRIDGELEVIVDHFGRGDVWGAGYRCRVVVPQLTLKSKS